MPMVIHILELCWPILSHSDVKGKLEIILIREESTLDNEETVDEIESFLFKLNQQLNTLDS